MSKMRDRLRLYHDFWSTFWRSELVLFVAVTVIGLLLGFRTIQDYGYALVMAGIALLIIEIFAPSEPFTNVRGLVYQRGLRSWKGLEDPVDTQLKQHPSGFDDRIPIEHFHDVVIGVFPIVVGLIIQAVF